MGKRGDETWSVTKTKNSSDVRRLVSLQPARWTPPLRIFLILLVLAAFSAFILLSARFFDLNLTSLGWTNLAFSTLTVGWYAVDGAASRRSLYNAFGLEEPILQFEVRFWRKVALLASAVLAISSALIAVTPDAPDGAPGYYPTLVTLAGVFVAALGWMLTAFEREKADRIKNTLDAIRHQLYDKEMVAVHDHLVELTAAARKAAGLDRNQPVPADQVEKLQIKDKPSFRSSLIKLLNSLDQVALGVRCGHYDFTTVMLVLRARYLRIAFSYTPYIAQETKARVHLGRKDRFRFIGGDATWEHLRWIVGWFDARDISLSALEPWSLNGSDGFGDFATTEQTERGVAPRA